MFYKYKPGLQQTRIIFVFYYNIVSNEIPNHTDFCVIGITLNYIENKRWHQGLKPRDKICMSLYLHFNWIIEGLLNMQMQIQCIC